MVSLFEQVLDSFGVFYNNQKWEQLCKIDNNFLYLAYVKEIR